MERGTCKTCADGKGFFSLPSCLASSRRPRTPPPPPPAPPRSPPAPPSQGDRSSHPTGNGGRRRKGGLLPLSPRRWTHSGTEGNRIRRSSGRGAWSGGSGCCPSGLQKFMIFIQTMILYKKAKQFPKETGASKKLVLLPK